MIFYEKDKSQIDTQLAKSFLDIRRKSATIQV